MMKYACKPLLCLIFLFIFSLYNLKCVLQRVFMLYYEISTKSTLSPHIQNSFKWCVLLPLFILSLLLNYLIYSSYFFNLLFFHTHIFSQQQQSVSIYSLFFLSLLYFKFDVFLFFIFCLEAL